MRCICFFHRNEFHNQIFPRMGSYLKSVYGVSVKHVRRIGGVAGEEVLEYEKEIEKMWRDIDISATSFVRLEERYPASNLLRLLYADRSPNFFPKYLGRKKITYEEQLKYLVGCFLVFEKFLDGTSADCVVTDLSIGIADIFRYVCERRGVEYLTMRSSKLGQGLIFTDPDYDTPARLYDLYNQYLKTGIPADLVDPAQSHLSSIREKVTAPPYMEVTKKRYRILSIERLRAFVKNSIRKASRVTSISFDKHPILTSIQWNVNKLINIRVTRWNKCRWFTQKLSSDMKYYVFTLQYEPENSTAIRSYPFSNQISMIENIAKALPLGVYLVVKEHKGNQGYRKYIDYRDIWYLPNVKLVAPDFPVNDLICNSLGVITLTSRMGWEALVLGKKVIGLGTTFYSGLNGVIKPRSWSDLRDALREIKQADIHCDMPDKLDAFAAAYFALTYDGKYVYKGHGVTSDENIQLLSEAVIAEIKLRK